MIRFEVMIFIAEQNQQIARVLAWGLCRYGLSAEIVSCFQRFPEMMPKISLLIVGDLSFKDRLQLSKWLYGSDVFVIEMLLHGKTNVAPMLPNTLDQIIAPMPTQEIYKKIQTCFSQRYPKKFDVWQEKSTEPGVSTDGEIRDDIPEMLAAFDFFRENGSVHFSSGEITKTIFFRNGWPVLANSTEASERIGEILIDGAKITRDQLNSALEEQRNSTKRIGAIFVEHGYLNEEERKLALQLQTELIVLSLFAWESGTFTLNLEDHLFAEGELWQGEIPPKTILRGIQLHYSLERLQKHLPGPASVLELSPLFYERLQTVYALENKVLHTLKQGLRPERVVEAKMGTLEMYQCIYSLIVNKGIVIEQ